MIPLHLAHGRRPGRQPRLCASAHSSSTGPTLRRQPAGPDGSGRRAFEPTMVGGANHRPPGTDRPRRDGSPPFRWKVRERQLGPECRVRSRAPVDQPPPSGEGRSTIPLTRGTAVRIRNEYMKRQRGDSRRPAAGTRRRIDPRHSGGGYRRTRTRSSGGSGAVGPRSTRYAHLIAGTWAPFADYRVASASGSVYVVEMRSLRGADQLLRVSRLSHEPPGHLQAHRRGTPASGWDPVFPRSEAGLERTHRGLSRRARRSSGRARDGSGNGRGPSSRARAGGRATPPGSPPGLRKGPRGASRAGARPPGPHSGLPPARRLGPRRGGRRFGGTANERASRPTWRPGVARSTSSSGRCFPTRPKGVLHLAFGERALLADDMGTREDRAGDRGERAAARSARYRASAGGVSRIPQGRPSGRSRSRPSPTFRPPSSSAHRRPAAPPTRNTPSSRSATTSRS